MPIIKAPFSDLIIMKRSTDGLPLFSYGLPVIFHGLPIRIKEILTCNFLLLVDRGRPW